MGRLLMRDRLPWLAIGFALLGAICLCGLTGCGRGFDPAPRSVDSMQAVYADARAWAGRGENRYWSAVAPTGSMEPFVNEHSLLLMVKYTGQKLPNGTVASFRRSDDFPNVLHVITDQNETHVYMSGYANKNSDGWFPKTSIHGFMVGQLYTP
jgi:hypothetical protein